MLNLTRALESKTQNSKGIDNIMFESFNNSLISLCSILCYIYRSSLDKKAFDSISKAWKNQAFLIYRRIVDSKDLLGKENTEILLGFLNSQLNILDESLDILKLEAEYKDISKIIENITK